MGKKHKTIKPTIKKEPIEKELYRSGLFELQQIYLESIFSDFQDRLANGGYTYSGQEREAFPVYDAMDMGDCSAILDIYASATITNSPIQDFRPFEVNIEPRFNNVEISENLKKFIKFNEEISSLFTVVHGVARDGYKYGSSFERMILTQSDMFGNRGIISKMESIKTPSMYPLKKEGSEEIIKYMEEKDASVDFYDISRYTDSSKSPQPISSTNNKKIRVFHNPSTILPFFNKTRSTDWMGVSILKPIVEDWNSKKASESKVLAQRMTRSAQKLVHAIETKDLQPKEIEERIKLLQSFNRGKKRIIEISGKLNQKQNIADSDSDLITFLQDGKGGVTSVSGDGDIRSMRDVDYWRHSLYTTTHIPPSYILDSTLKNASRDAVGEMDKLFETIISTGRRKLGESFLLPYYRTLIDLYFNRVGEHEKYKIEFRWLPISTLEELRREKSIQIRSMIAKIWRLDLDIPDEFIYKRIFRMNKQEISELMSMPKPDPLVYQTKMTSDPMLGQNTTSPKTTPKPKAKKEAVEEFLKYLDENSSFFTEKEINEMIDLLEEGIENEQIS